MKQIIIIIILIAVAGAAAIFVFGNPFNDNIGLIDISTTEKLIEVEDKGYYVVYYPNNYVASEIKRMVLVIQPNDDYLSDLNKWKKQSNTHGFAIAAIPDWNFELIAQFNKDVRLNENVEKIYYTGFSAGGYASCNQGLGNQKYVDGIIPMGSYCTDSDLLDQPQTIPILTIIGALDNWALGDELIRPDQQQYSYATNINTEYVLIPNIGHQFPSSYMDEVGKWVMQN